MGIVSRFLKVWEEKEMINPSTTATAATTNIIYEKKKSTVGAAQ